jgi:hypothetical protein
LGLEDIGHASDLNDMNISLSAGMAKGLPLANPQQAGIILQGKIFQALGNWAGTAQTVDIFFQAGGDGNFPFSWAAGTPMADAIKRTLAVGMPNIPVTVNISNNLVLNHTETGHYPSLDTFSQAVNEISRGIIGGTTYPGVTIAGNGTVINVFDTLGPTAPVVKAIAPSDLMGQPTWIGAQTISFKTVLRADIHIGSTVSIPQTIFAQGQDSLRRFSNDPKSKLTFAGKFLVTQVHHYGNSRQPDASAWNTTFQAAIVNN